ncbi:MAG: FixH family protein [Alphaproteobacteria bacterium]|nr:FixH family protein [Alphaproteobacteria bacterium]
MEKTRQRGWWYPYIFVGAFLVVIGVNATLAYFATSTFTGLAETDAYEKGRLYNRALEAAKAQADMGWTVDTKLKPVAGVQPGVDIDIAYKDRDGKPVEGLAVTASVIRPTLGGFDHQITLAPLGGGRYGGHYDLPLNGVWDLEMAALGEGASYQHSQRIVVP